MCVCVFFTQTGAFDHSTFDVEFKCNYFVSELVEFRIAKGGGEIVLTQPQCAHAHVCLACLMLFCCTVKYTSARVDDVVGSVSHLCIYL